MRIMITGGTGFIGSHLVAALRRPDVPGGPHDLTLVSRSGGEQHGQPLKRWDPTRAGDWYALVDGQDAVIHLAGEQAVGTAWTEATKKRIRDSRVVSTTRLVEAMEAAQARPSVFVCASAVGYYGPRDGDEVLDESAEPGDDFLARVTVDWEAAAAPAADLGVRVVNPRIGIVLGRGGGALEQMMLPFKMFAGGPIGSGRQVVSWVHVLDAVEAMVWSVCGAGASAETPIAGAFNLTAPNPVTNRELSAAIGRAMDRPSWMPVPALALKARFGEGAQPLVTGQRAVPKRLLDGAFPFRFELIDGALRDLVGSR